MMEFQAWQALGFTQFQSGQDIDLNSIGYATAREVKLRNGEWRIHMDFDLKRCHMLWKSPISAGQVRQWVHYPRRNVISLAPYKSQIQRRVPWNAKR